MRYILRCTVVRSFFDESRSNVATGWNLIRLDCLHHRKLLHIIGMRPRPLAHYAHRQHVLGRSKGLKMVAGPARACYTLAVLFASLSPLPPAWLVPVCSSFAESLHLKACRQSGKLYWHSKLQTLLSMKQGYPKDRRQGST